MAKRNSKQFWFEHVAAAQSCGISKAAYCRSQGLTYKTFLRWSWLLQAGATAPPARQSLVPVAIREAAPLDHMPMTLRIGADISLSMPASTDAAWLGTLLRTVSTC